MFQCYSLKSSHPCLLPLSPKVCSLHLCIFCCPERGIVGCYSSVSQSCGTLCDPMDLSMPGFLVLHHLLEFAQAHVHWVSDAIQSSHPLLPASPPAFNLSQHQGLFYESALCIRCQITGASASALVLPTNIQGWFSLGLTGLNSLLYKELSTVFSSTTVRKHQFFGAQPSSWSNSHICAWLLEKP